MSEKIVIIGFGWVGQANALALLYDDYAVSYFDTQSPEEHYERSDEYKKIRKLSTALEVDGPETYYLVCVGDRVDEAGNQDIRTIEKALDSLTKARGTVILRSTVLPSSLDHLKFDIYVPEFLHEKAAVKECINPEFIVIGKKDPHTKTPAFIETWRKRSGKFVGSVPNAFTLKHRIRFLFGSKKNTPIDDPTHINHFHIEELRGILSKHFGSVEIIGLGTYKSLIKISPNLFGFDLFFVCKDPIPN